MCFGRSLELANTKERIKILNKRTLVIAYGFKVIGYNGEFSDIQESSRILNELILEDQLETNG